MWSFCGVGELGVMVMMKVIMVVLLFFCVGRSSIYGIRLGYCKEIECIVCGFNLVCFEFMRCISVLVILLLVDDRVDRKFLVLIE